MNDQRSMGNETPMGPLSVRPGGGKNPAAATSQGSPSDFCQVEGNITYCEFDTYTDAGDEVIWIGKEDGGSPSDFFGGGEGITFGGGVMDIPEGVTKMNEGLKEYKRVLCELQAARREVMAAMEMIGALVKRGGCVMEIGRGDWMEEGEELEVERKEGRIALRVEKEGGR